MCIRDRPGAGRSPTGRLVITPQFEAATQFDEGLACVRIGDEKTGKWGFIDTQGHFIVNPQFDFGARFREGLAEVFFGSDKTGREMCIRDRVCSWH